MTDSDDKLLRRYRELPREEPPRALDDAILAASRRAVASRPSLARRWARPVSIAAVVVLAFGVTLEMQREQPGIEYKETAPPAPAVAPVETPAPTKAPLKEPPPRAMEADAVTSTAPARVPEPARRPAPELRKAAPPQELKEQAAPAQEKEMARSRDEPQAFPQYTAPQAPPAAPPPPVLEKFRDANVAPAPAARPAMPASPTAPAVTSAPTGAPAPAAAPAAPAAASSGVMNAPRAKSESLDAARAPARSLATPADPERELERIAKLRDDGRNDEADKALEEFKRRYPDFRIPDATWSRVKPR